MATPELWHLGEEAEDTTRPQQQGHHVGKVCQELPDERRGLHSTDGVAAIALEAGGSLGLG
jgi:hypothetical protein